MTGRLVSCAILLACVLLLPHDLQADEFVIAEVWTELDSIFDFGTERPVPQDVALDRILDDVQSVLSGLVYGYRFDYVPGDPARDIPESFSIEPFGVIERGDPGLTVLQTWMDGDRFVARVMFELNTYQAAWYRAWHGGSTGRSTGTGRSSVMRGPTSKMEAVSDGIRSAIREYVRAREFTRPRRITGAAILTDSPLFAIVEGSYQSTVEILLQIDRIDRFDTY